MSAQELEEARSQPRSKERAVLFSQLAAEAAERGEWELAVRARYEEIRDATFLDLDEQAVVAGTELLEHTEQLRAHGHALTFPLGRVVVWGLKYTSGSALSIPEVPLAAIERVHETVGTVLRELGLPEYAAQQLELHCAETAGEGPRVQALVRALMPHVSRRNTYRYFMDCVGCSLVQMADALGAHAPPEQLEALLRTPIADVHEGARGAGLTVALHFGADWGCDVAQYRAHEVYARSLAAAGRALEARMHAELSLRYQRAGEFKNALGPTVANLEAARCAGELGQMRSWCDALEARMEQDHSAYERHEALLAMLRAASDALRSGVPWESAGLARWESSALELGRRLDKRLVNPRHESLTREALRGA